MQRTLIPRNTAQTLLRPPLRCGFVSARASEALQWQ